MVSSHILYQHKKRSYCGDTLVVGMGGLVLLPEVLPATKSISQRRLRDCGSSLGIYYFRVERTKQYMKRKKAVGERFRLGTSSLARLEALPAAEAAGLLRSVLLTSTVFSTT
jgi:hypothetical protein